MANIIIPRAATRLRVQVNAADGGELFKIDYPDKRFKNMCAMAMSQGQGLTVEVDGKWVATIYHAASIPGVASMVRDALEGKFPEREKRLF